MLRRTFLLSGFSIVLVAAGSAAGLAHPSVDAANVLPWTPISARPTPTVEPDEASLPGGLGNTRADLEHQYGAPKGLKGTMVAYRQGTIAVSYVDERATAILVSFSGEALTDLGAARAKVKDLLPLGSSLVGTLGAGPNRVADIYQSARLGELVRPPHLEEPSGQFVVIYQSDNRGAITQALLAVGNVQDQSQNLA